MTVGHGPGVIRTPDRVPDRSDGCGDGQRTACSGPPRAQDRSHSATRREGDKIVARQKEDVRVANIVRERKHGVDAIREQDECAPWPARAPQCHGTHTGDEHARHTELLAQVEEEHRQMVECLVGRHAEHHRFAPVCLGHVEPERCQLVRPLFGRVDVPPQRDQIRQVLQCPGAGNQQCHGERRRPEELRRPAHRHQQEHRERHQEQDHRQVIAERERIHDEERREARPRRAPLVREQRDQAHADQHQVKGIDFGNDGLVPIGV